MATALSFLLAGDPLVAVITVYTNLIGMWFYVFGISIVLLMVYFKSKNLATVSIIGLLLGSAMVQLDIMTAEYIGILYLIMGGSVVGVLYSIFGPKSE